MMYVLIYRKDGLVAPSKENLCIAKIPLRVAVQNSGVCDGGFTLFQLKCLWAKIPILNSSFTARMCRAGGKRMEVQIGTTVTEEQQ